MDALTDKTDRELLDSLLAEVAKSSNEIRCAKQDIDKIQNRLSFAVVLLNELNKRD